MVDGFTNRWPRLSHCSSRQIGLTRCLGAVFLISGKLETGCGGNKESRRNAAQLSIRHSRYLGDVHFGAQALTWEKSGNELQRARPTFDQS